MGLVLLKNCSGGNGTPGEFNANTLHYVEGVQGGMQLIAKNLSGITGLRDNAFKNQDIVSVEIPSNIRSIGQDAFNNTLRTLTITPRITTSTTSISMANDAFKNNVDIGDINISTLEGWLMCSFANIEANPLSHFDPVIHNCSIGGNDISTLIIPEGVERIRPRAFCSAADLYKDFVHGYQWEGYINNLTLPSTLTNIGTEAFKNSLGVRVLTLPDALDTVGNDAFTGCGAYNVYIGTNYTESTNAFRRVFVNNPNRTYLEVSQQNPTYYSIDNCILNRYDNSVVWGAINSVIPTDSNVTEIASYAFMDLNETSKTFTIPNNITTIGEYAFKNNESFEHIVVGSGMVTIGRNVFNGCIGLAGGIIDVPYTTTLFSQYCFANISGNEQSIITMNYPGTKDEFKHINKSNNWLDNSCQMNVYCSDGGFEYYQSNQPRHEW